MPILLQKSAAADRRSAISLRTAGIDLPTLTLFTRLQHYATHKARSGELAGPMNVHAPSLHRLMRTLANLGILTEQAEGRFALTSLGEALKTGAPGSAKSAVIFAVSP